MGKINKSIVTIFLFLLINSCSTSPYNVGKDDAQVVLNTDIGVIIDVVPVKIKGNPSEVGAVVGGIVGGVLAEDVGSGSGTDIAVIAGSTVGGIIGYYSTVKLGEHNGFQYTISVDGEKKPVGVIQGIDKKKDYNFKIGDRVTIVYGEKARVLPSKN